MDHNSHHHRQRVSKTSPRESLVSWVSESTRPSMEYPSIDDSQREDGEEVAYIPGQIITNCRPFVHIVTEEMKGRICDLCLRPPSSALTSNSNLNSHSSKPQQLRRCNDCQAMYFCSSCLASRTPSVFKALHLLECSIYARYSAQLSNPSKLFLRLYLRLSNPESIPAHTYVNPLTGEEITFEALVPRLIYNSHEEMAEHIKDFCEANSLKISGGSDKSFQSSPSSISSSASKAKNRRKKKSGSSKAKEQLYQSIADFTLNDGSSVEEIAIYQFMHLLDEFSRVEPLLPLLADDHNLYHLWTVFVRLWSYATPILDETVTGILSGEDPASAIAYGLYLEPNSLLFGHSCLPNTALAFYGPVLQLRAMRAIYAGETLTTNLVSISVPKRDRLHQLRSFFISTCFCPRCVYRAKVGEEEEFDGALSPLEYDTFRSLKEEFITTFEASFGKVYGFEDKDQKNLLSLTAILNFTSGGEQENEESGIEESYRRCNRLYAIGKRLQPLYAKLYPYFHPEKSRFVYAQTAVEMNRLLFKLDGSGEGEGDNEEEGDNKTGNRLSTASSATNNRISDCSDFTTSIKTGNLDVLTEQINAWSTMLKDTVRSIRITHGLDHRIYREVAVPLAPVWKRASQISPKSPLTLAELHRDPAVLLKILINSGSGRQSLVTGNTGFSAIGSHLETVANVFGQLFGEAASFSEFTSKSLLLEKKKVSFEEDGQNWWHVFGRALLVFFAFLFPLFIYYVVYVEDL